MLKTIQLLNKQPQLLKLLKEEKVCLVGVSESETKSILETYSKDASELGVYWN
ncbi:competence pheromone ComX [Psychrobacillus sp.]|uniref:competence pheromone ComX n=1 Tax=Psychrobacillus sp. TaxID=1871623 RepID=UPI0028BE6C06|nr:competence pheromone ComX [Psychrobacillus sp.]